MALMPNSAKRKLAAGAAGLVVLAGTGGAYAATKSGSTATPPDHAAEQKAFLDDLAGRLNVARDKLDAAIKGAAAARIDAAVAAGRLTKEQGDAAKKRIESANGVPLLGPGFGIGGRGMGPGGPHALPGGHFGPLESFDSAAKYLGLTADGLETQLHSGKSLADVAKDKGKDLAGLKAALKTDITAQLDAAVKAKRLTDAQRTEILKDLDQRIDDLVTRKPGTRGPGMRGFRHHP
jgi:hypothetical protein